jgi:hypothetical protein
MASETRISMCCLAPIVEAYEPITIMNIPICLACGEPCNAVVEEIEGNVDAAEDRFMQEDDPYSGYNTHEGIPDHFD